MDRDWSIASQKASNAIVEGLSFQFIRDFYERQGVRMSRIDYNSSLDLTGKQRFDLIDGNGKTWEIKCDKIAVQTGRAFVEQLDHSDFDYLMLIAFFPYILTRQTYSDIIGNQKYRAAEGGDYGLAKGKFVSLEELRNLSL
jgi:hypothetical protein